MIYFCVIFFIVAFLAVVTLPTGAAFKIGQRVFFSTVGTLFVNCFHVINIADLN